MTKIVSQRLFGICAAALVQILVLPSLAVSQEEVASALRRYKQQEASTGFYEEYEVMPRHRAPMIEVPGVRQNASPYTSTAARVRIRTRLWDAHQGIKFYEVLTCEYCHPEQAKDFHTVRGNLTCRQCHGVEPISGIQSLYSPLNPIRRHAYVCAKCHQGASVSFASYVVHQPTPGSEEAKNRFPVLYYTYWFMLVLLSGTLAFFIPHTFLVGIRELIMKIRKKEKNGGHLH